jgi:hypothetical protein
MLEMMLDIEKARKMLDLLYTFRDLNKEIKDLEREINKILRASIDLGAPAEAIKNVEIEIKERPFKEIELAPLRCVETIYPVNRVAIRDYGLVLEGSPVRREVRLATFDVYDLLTLACNLEVSEVEALINAIREKKRELENDLAKLKELVAYAKLILS